MNQKLLLVLLLGSSLFLAGCLGNPSRPPKPELCQQVSLAENKDLCFHRVAVTTGKVEYCSQIKDMNRKDLCLMDLAEGNTWISNPAND